MIAYVARRPRPCGRSGTESRVAASSVASCSKHLPCIISHYRDGVLHAEAVDLTALADAVGTPFYCYSSATIERHYKVFAGAFADVDALVCYAMKANSNQAVIATLAQLGAGADVVSEGELLRARAAGVPPDKIMFSGVGKTARELALAVDENILCINVESEPELELLSSIAAAKGRIAAISIRVNPDVDPKTHAKIATGKAENKFGIPISRAREVYARAAKLKGVRVIGVDMHIGSQIIELDPFGDAFALLADFVGVLRADGHSHHACRSRRRPGHSLSRGQRAAARSGRLCGDRQARDQESRLQADLRAGPADRRQCRHPGDARHLCEARRGQDLRHRRCRHERSDPPDALRGASRHPAGAPAAPSARGESPPTWSGRFASPAISSRSTARWSSRKPGDLLAVMTAGAYGATQSGTYNSRPLIPEVLVRNDEWAVIRPRADAEELIALDRLPDWL